MYSDPRDKLFCEIGGDLGYLTNDQIQRALDAQRVDRAMGVTKPIGSYLYEEKILTKEQIAQIVKMQEKMRSPQESHFESSNINRPRQSVTLPANRTQADIGSVIVWFFVCFPLGYAQWHQSGKGWAWLLINVLTSGLAGIPMIIDYWMCYAAQQKRSLGPWEWFPH